MTWTTREYHKFHIHKRSSVLVKGRSAFAAAAVLSRVSSKVSGVAVTISTYVISVKKVQCIAPRLKSTVCAEDDIWQLKLARWQILNN